MKTCDGTCFEPFLKAAKKHFGKDAEMPISFRMLGGKLVSMLTPPEVKVREGRRWKRTALILPFCGICGKKNQ